MLRHGITTVRDVSGPLLPPSGGDGELRLLSSGPLIQAPGGYPISIFGGSSGYDQIGIPVNGPDETRTVVRNLIQGGATHIKIALEYGGKGEDPLEGKGLFGRSMLGDKGGIVESFSEFAEESGMDVAKPCLNPIHSGILIKSIGYHNPSALPNLT